MNNCWNLPDSWRCSISLWHNQIKQLDARVQHLEVTNQQLDSKVQHLSILNQKYEHELALFKQHKFAKKE